MIQKRGPQGPKADQAELELGASRKGGEGSQQQVGSPKGVERRHLHPEPILESGAPPDPESDGADDSDHGEEPGLGVDHTEEEPSLDSSESVEFPEPIERTEPTEAERLAHHGREAAAVGRLETAIEWYREAVECDPGLTLARLELGALLDRKGAHAEALGHLQAVVHLEPANPAALTAMGNALAASARFEEAEAVLLTALRLDPEGHDSRAGLGILYFRRGLYEKAEAELRWVCDRAPDHGAAHFYRGETLNRLGRFDEALRTLEQASRLQPDNPRIYYIMGVLYDRKHLGEEAGAMYRKARELTVR